MGNLHRCDHFVSWLTRTAHRVCVVGCTRWKEDVTHSPTSHRDYFGTSLTFVRPSRILRFSPVFTGQSCAFRSPSTRNQLAAHPLRATRHRYTLGLTLKLCFLKPQQGSNQLDLHGPISRRRPKSREKNASNKPLPDEITTWV